MKSELTATEVFTAQKELERREYLKHLEKVARAGKVLAEAVEKMEVDAGFQGNSTDYKCLINQRDAALDTYNQAIK